MDNNWNNSPGESARIWLTKAAGHLGRMQPSQRRSLSMGACALVLGIAWNHWLEPGFKAQKEISLSRLVYERHATYIEASKRGIKDPNGPARDEAEKAEAAASEAERAVRERVSKSGAAPDLPAVVAAAAGKALVLTETDGDGWPSATPDGRWLHRIETKIAAEDWDSLEESVRRVEAAAFGAKTFALDVGVVPDGRIAARIEMAVVGPDRDWLGRNVRKSDAPSDRVGAPESKKGDGQ